MIPKLPLHSPRWRDLDGVTAKEVEVLLEQMTSTAASGAATESGEGWRQTWTCLAEGLLDDGTVFDGAYAALPYLVEAAAALPPGQSVDFWVDLGCIVTAEDRPPVPADLEAGFSAALLLAEQAAVRDLLAADAPPEVCFSLALSCVAFAGHHIGTALWSLQPQEGYLQLVCPGCGSDTEILEFFVDPVRPPLDAPGLPDPVRARPGQHPWGEVATALREETLGEGWEPFLRTARGVAAAGIPPETPGPAVLCLVAGIVAAKGTPQRAGSEWARELTLLTGYFRCWDCERTWTIADGLAENPDGAHPQNHPGGESAAADDSASTVTSTADVDCDAAGPTGEAPSRLRQDGTALLSADGTSWGRISVFTDSASLSTSTGGVDSLTVLARPGRPTLVAGAGFQDAVCLWDVSDGRLVQDPLTGHADRIRSMRALTLPDGRVLLATGGETGAITLWDPATGRPVREPFGDRLGEVIGMCAATVPDGRTLLVTAAARGAVRLWDPATGESVGSLNPYGSPIQSIAAVPISAGHTLIAAADTGGRVHVWDPAVEDPWERGAAVPLSKNALSAADHRAAAVAALPTQDRTLLATGDDRGVVMLWDLTTGDPVGDALPSSTGTAGLPVMAATTLDGGRSVLVTGSRLRRSLRVWEPETGAVRHIALEVALTSLAAAGPDLIVGHDRGALGLPLAGR
jgi:WD40 repeat protein